MGEDVVSSYLRSKLSSILQEAESDSGSPSHIISRFRSIERQINFMSEANSPTIPVDHLYELIEALSDCRVFSYQRRTATAPISNNPCCFHFNFHPLSELMFKRRMRKRLNSIEKKLRNNNPTPGDSSPPPPAKLVIQQTYPIEDPSLIIGFETQADTIEAWLIPSSEEEEEGDAAFRVVGIVGRCGCGKTALAQKVFASARIVEEFSPRIWVCLSNMLFDADERVDPRVRVVNYILEEIGHDVSELEYSDYSLVRLVEKLQRGLMGKRYLVVLDDAWRLDEWYAATGEFLSHGLPKGSGGAVIVTSRRENVIGRMVGDDNHVIRLQPHLSDGICWQIFSKVVQQQGKMDLTHPNLSTIEDDIKRNFDGLPLAAKTLANLLPTLL